MSEEEEEDEVEEDEVEVVYSEKQAGPPSLPSPRRLPSRSVTGRNWYGSHSFTCSPHSFLLYLLPQQEDDIDIDAI